MKNRALSYFLLLLIIPAITGCLVATQDTIITPQIQTLFKGTYKTDPYLEKNIPKSIAILPFQNEAKSKQGSEEVRRGFYNHFSSLPFKDMEIHRVDDLLRKAGMTDPEIINQAPATELGRILGVDAVIYGTISNFDKLFAVVYSAVSVGAEIKMYDTKTGNFLWSGKHVTRIHEGGISTTPVGLIATVIATAMNIRDIQLLRACDDLFREMVKTIPTPPLALALRPPLITLLTQDSQNKPKKAGDEIRVVLQGAPKMTAYFQIGEYRKNIDMQEIEPGGYLGIYKVLPGDNISQAMITGFLRDDAGNTSSWVDALGAVTLDTTPPDPPKQLKVVGRNNLTLVKWVKSLAADLAGYRIYRSNTPLTGFQQIARTELTEYRDENLKNAEKYYYLVTATDLAGNESNRSEIIMGMPVAPGPTPVGGVIEADTIWYAGAAPYLLTRDVLVKDKALLTIEPGTRILSRGASLIIEGRLNARGDAENIIEFDAAESNVNWPGVRFINVKDRDNHLSFVRIRNAETAVICDSSSPRIENSEFTENKNALRISGAFSKPEITRSIFHKNRAAVLIITDGAQPLVTENNLRDNLNEALIIQGGTPIIRHNNLIRNGGNGILIQGGNPTITGNNIYGNQPFNIAGDASDTRDNWLGSVKGLEILAGIRGRINIKTVLNAPYPEGKPMELPILAAQLGDVLTKDAFLILANSPYLVQKNLVIDGGATLFVEPGVVIHYGQNTSIIIENGGITALGTKEHPIVFTAGASTPSPGYYHSAIRFRGKENKVNSSIRYGIFQYAETALDIHYGAPEIAYSYIARNSQSGIFCRNDAAPRISFCTIEENQGEGGIKAVGMSRPVINNNNFRKNDIAHIQAFSSIRINAMNNWWEKAPPDDRGIFKHNEDSINIAPWLTAPDDRAFVAPK